MARGLDNTLSGMDVTAGDEALNDQSLPPEALAIMQLLGSISNAPTAEDTATGMANAKAAYAPLLAANAVPGTPPAQASPLGQFLTLLSSNIAGTVRPEFGQPGRQALAQQQEEQDIFKGSERERTKTGLELAAKMTEQGLKAAQDAGDDRAAAQKAIQLARLNDALIRSRNTQRIGEQAAATAGNIKLTASERVRAGADLKARLNKLADEADLSTAGKIRLKAQATFLATFLDNVTRVDPTTGEPQLPLQPALKAAQTQFDEFLQQQLEQEGKAPKGAAPAAPAAGADLFSRVKARLDTTKKAK